MANLSDEYAGILKNRLDYLNGKMVEHASESARYLLLGEYSSAAAEAHRAHQTALRADELRGVLTSHG